MCSEYIEYVVGSLLLLVTADRSYSYNIGSLDPWCGRIVLQIIVLVLVLVLTVVIVDDELATAGDYAGCAQFCFCVAVWRHNLLKMTLMSSYFCIL